MQKRDILEIFKQGLKNSVNRDSLLKPVDLHACLLMAKYACKISSGLVTGNCIKSVAIIKSRDEPFRLLIHLDEAVYNNNQAFLIASLVASSKITFNIQTNNEWKENDSIMYLETIVPLSDPDQVHLEKAKRFFKVMDGKN